MQKYKHHNSWPRSTWEGACTHTQEKEKRFREREKEVERERERAVNTPLWCVLKPHKMASNHNRDMFRRKEVFSVWFTLKPSLIPVWWLPWVFAVPDLTPIALTQSNFWALFELPRASYLIMNRGRIIYENLAAWNPHTGSVIIIKACSTEIIKRSVDEGGSDRQKQKKNSVSVCHSKFKRWI